MPFISCAIFAFDLSLFIRPPHKTILPFKDVPTEPSTAKGYGDGARHDKARGVSCGMPTSCNVLPLLLPGPINVILSVPSSERYQPLTYSCENEHF